MLELFLQFNTFENTNVKVNNCAKLNCNRVMIFNIHFLTRLSSFINVQTNDPELHTNANKQTVFPDRCGENVFMHKLQTYEKLSIEVQYLTLSAILPLSHSPEKTEQKNTMFSQLGIIFVNTDKECKYIHLKEKIASHASSFKSYLVLFTDAT